MKKASEKEIYRLWWDCLRESEGYKAWLEAKAEQHRRAWELAALPSGPPITMPELPGEKKWRIVHMVFGDVHNTAFEDWWKRRFTHTIADYSHWVVNDMVECFRVVRREPDNPDLFQIHLCEEMVHRIEQSLALHLVVDVNADLDELTKQFRARVLRQRGDKRSELAAPNNFYHPTCERLRLQEYRKYLKVHRFAKEKGKDLCWKDLIGVMRQIDPEGFKEYLDADSKKVESLRSLYQKHKRKAEKLITNAENGTFPGHIE